MHAPPARLERVYYKYRVPRFSEAPALEVILIDRKDVPSAGPGETR